MKGIIILTVCLLTATVAYSSAPVNELLSLEENFSTATAKSKQFSKSQILIFSAEWCAPCIKMKESTLKDANLVSYLNENTINSMVNIDTKEGFRLMSLFGIKELPSIIILDENGKEVARRKEFLSASGFLKFVESNITPSSANKTITSEIKNATEPKSVVKTEAKSEVTPKPASNVKEKVNDSEVNSAKIFGVQVGIYSNFETALAESARIQKLMPDSDILILNRPNGSQTQLRLVIGAYISRDAARIVKTDLQSKGVEGFIKDLSAL